MKLLILGLLISTTFSSSVFATNSYTAKGGEKLLLIMVPEDLNRLEEYGIALEKLKEKCENDLGGRLVGKVTTSERYDSRYGRLASMCAF